MRLMEYFIDKARLTFSLIINPGDRMRVYLTMKHPTECHPDREQIANICLTTPNYSLVPIVNFCTHFRHLWTLDVFLFDIQDHLFRFTTFEFANIFISVPYEE